MGYLKFNKIIYTQDFLRVNESEKNLFNTPFKGHLRWLKVLVGEIIAEALCIESFDILHGDEGGANSLRWKVFRELDMPFSIESWSYMYEDMEVSDSLSNNIQGKFEGALIISYESSPALLKQYDNLGLQYLDFSIHPIRYLEDYVFGIRTNIDSLRIELQKYIISETICRNQARVYRAKASKIPVFENIPEGSVLFVGQMGIDSSLIENKRMIDLEDVKEYLVESARLFPRVYYKRHPHNKSFSQLNDFIEKQKNIELGDWNIYDCLGSGVFAQIRSISSGTLYEARYFGCDTKRLTTARNYYDITEADDNLTYYGVLKLPMEVDFWKAIFDGYDYVFEEYDPYKDGLQKSLNAVWGKK